jgi:hypothetical protein
MKWVFAVDLDRWADTIGSRYTLSELVSGLVRATAKEITAFRFPTGDSAQLPGYDGRLEADGFPPYVPAGLSVWEFGTSDPPRGQAGENFRKRSDEPGSIRPEDATFVFVTPRAFRTKEDWIQECLGKKAWKNVQVIDGVDLEAWLENAPAVALAFAQRNLAKMPQSGVMSADEFWREYSGRTDPALTEQVLLAGRREQTEQLLELLGSNIAQPIVVRADSQDEALAFTIATIRTASEDLGKYLDARTLIVDDIEIGRLVSAYGRLIIGLRALSKQPSNVLIQAGNIVVVPLGNNAPNQRVTVMLGRPPRDVFGEALTSMKLDQEKAGRLARECGRSVTILQRRIPAIAVQNPEWVNDGATREVLIPALLAGAWDSNFEQDRSILAKFAGSSYHEFERRLQPLLIIEAPPIERIGTIWTLVAPVDSFELLARFIARSDFDLLRTAAIEVFSEIDPALDLSIEERPYAFLQGKTIRHSSWLRDGLVSTLLLAVVRGEYAGLIPGRDIQTFVNQLIADLPGLAKDYRLLASLGSQLPYLMEAAPDPLVSALEHLLEGDGRDMVGIFSESSLLGPSSPHTHLLWALELLAWDPDYLPRVSLILAKLSRIDPGGRLSNRPIHSLRGIYLPWYPCTNASLNVRMRVLDTLLEKEPDIGWDLLVKLLPKDHLVSPTYRPRWRDSGASDKEVLTPSLAIKGSSEIVLRALHLIGENPVRWQVMIKGLSTFSEEDIARLCDLLDRYAEGVSSVEDKVMVWNTLQGVVKQHRRFASADWALPDSVVGRLDEISEKLKPRDPIQQHLWLFESYHPDLPLGEERWSLEAIDRFRLKALAEIVEDYGSPGILRLAKAARFPALVGAAAAEFFADSARRYELLESALDEATPENFVVALSGRAAQLSGERWTSFILSRVEDKRWDAQRTAAVILGWPDEVSTWETVETLGASVDRLYWERKTAWPLRGSAQDISFAVRKYAEVGRAAEALDNLHGNVSELNPNLILLLLDRALVEVNSRDSYGDLSWVSEIFNALAKRTDIEPLELARREYSWLPVLDDGGSALTLHKLLREEPQLFVDILCDVYREHSREEAEEVTEEHRIRAEFGFRLLQSLRGLPGLRADGTIDKEELQKWIVSVRSGAAERDRSDVADNYIGHLLAYSPVDPEDGAWPHRIIREVLEELAAPKVESGIGSEQFNKRGVFSKAMFEGGAQERELAEEARKWASASIVWPRTARMLKDIASTWDRQAEFEDQRAEQDKVRFS